MPWCLTGGFLAAYEHQKDWHDFIWTDKKRKLWLFLSVYAIVLDSLQSSHCSGRRIFGKSERGHIMMACCTQTPGNLGRNFVDNAVVGVQIHVSQLVKVARLWPLVNATELMRKSERNSNTKCYMSTVCSCYLVQVVGENSLFSFFSISWISCFTIYITLYCLSVNIMQLHDGSCIQLITFTVGSNFSTFLHFASIQMRRLSDLLKTSMRMSIQSFWSLEKLLTSRCFWFLHKAFF